MSYVMTRPLGASYADYISRPKKLSGINFGDGNTAAVFAAAVLVLVVYLAIARPDIQRSAETSPAGRRSSSPPAELLIAEPEFELD
jgi:uncharacterized membrane-anchored protein